MSKGLFIPDEILMNDELSLAERMVLSQVCTRAHLSDGSCKDTNEQLAGVLRVHPLSISRCLSVLAKKEYVNWFQRGRDRWINPVDSLMNSLCLNPDFLAFIGTSLLPDGLPPSAHQLRQLDKKACHKLKKPYCEQCGVDNKTPILVNGNTYTSLSMHHLVPVRQGGTAIDGIVTLCERCHRAIHTVDGQFSWSHVNTSLTELYLKAQ